MATFKLGESPKSFNRVVKFQMIDGTEGALTITYTHRDRIQYGTFVDDWQKARQKMAEADAAEAVKAHEAAMKKHEKTIAKAKKDGVEPPAQPEVDLMKSGAVQRKMVEAQADFIMHIAEGWDLEVPFNVENVRQLCAEQPDAAMQIQGDYRDALMGLRAKN